MKNRMAFFNGRCLFIGLGLSHILKLTGTDFWICGILGTILGIIILTLVKNVNNYRFLKSVVGFILALISCSILVDMGHSLYLKNTPIILLSSCAAIGAFIISQGNSNGIKKSVYIFYLYSMFLFISKFLLLQQHVEFNNLMPYFSTGMDKIILGTLVFALTGIVPVLSFNDLNEKKELILSYLVSMITVLSIAFLIITVMGVNEARLYRYPEYIVLKRIDILDFISNVDNIFTFALVGDLLFTMASGLKNIEVKGKYTSFIILILLIMCSSLLVIQNWPLILLYEYLPIFLIILLILILFPKKNLYKCVDK